MLLHYANYSVFRSDSKVSVDKKGKLSVLSPSKTRFTISDALRVCCKLCHPQRDIWLTCSTPVHNSEKLIFHQAHTHTPLHVVITYVNLHNGPAHTHTHTRSLNANLVGEGKISSMPRPEPEPGDSMVPIQFSGLSRILVRARELLSLP